MSDLSLKIQTPALRTLLPIPIPLTPSHSNYPKTNHAIYTSPPNSLMQEHPHLLIWRQDSFEPYSPNHETDLLPLDLHHRQ
jgi:hypothetical protein